ncbi:MAG: hypothetical protein HZC04_01830 [Candidatus Lloydbacteria bacterium]|nr:hypothetical protein [Candidatus Lloydbacteria bacterium]
MLYILCVPIGCASSTRHSIIQKSEVKTVTTGLFPCEANAENKHCVANIEKMLEQFRKIRVTDKKTDSLGDTVTEVTQKGFTICLNPLCTKFRSNTQEYRGTKALEAAGRGNFQQTFSGIKEVQEYGVFLGNISAQEYRETNIVSDADRICVNRDESLRYGYDFTFIILFEGGHVSDTLIKGGEVYEPKTEEALLKCPSGAIGSLLGSGMRALVPIP